MRDTLEKLLRGQLLSKVEASASLRLIASGTLPPAQVAAFLTAYRMREVTVQELSGFRAAMLELANPLRTETPTIDLCGTGGDGRNTFNISTTASFIVAASGVSVTKHGNYGISSICGSSNVLEFLKVPFARDEAHAKRQLEIANITFLHAPLWHPAMKTVAPIRKELGFKTIFNMLGPLVNPARPQFQLIGVHSKKLQGLYSELLKTEHLTFSVVHSHDGYDEISLTSEATGATASGMMDYSPECFKAPILKSTELECGKLISEYANCLMAILEGKGTAAQNAVVAANAAAALSLARSSSDLPTLFSEAVETIKSGKAAKLVTALQETA